MKIAPILVSLFFLVTISAFGQPAAITYQGRLADNGAPANGVYDLQFAIHDALTNGNAVSSVITHAAVAVTNGLFTVPLNFGAGVFDGSERWMEIGVRTNGSLDAFTLLIPRQSITATPYAIVASNASSANTALNVAGTAITGTIPDNRLSSNVALLNGNPAFSGTVTASSFSGSGSNLTGLWKLGGNAGTTPGTDFIGTPDNQALEFKANGNRVLRLEPGSSPTIVGGHPGNFVSGVGSVIAGGGSGTSTNSILFSGFSFIGSGNGNHILGSEAGVIGGGIVHTMDNSRWSFIGGGNANVISNSIQSFVGGGCVNQILNGPDSAASAIVGGWFNTVDASDYAFIGSGSDILIQSNSYSSIVSGDHQQILKDADYSTIAGGQNNRILGQAKYAAIGGGSGNIVQSNGLWATIPGGWLNSATNYSFAAGTRAKANHTGSFVWSDFSTNAIFATSGSNQFLVRASGGVGINTTNPTATLDVNGTIKAGSLVVSNFLGAADGQALEFQAGGQPAFRIESVPFNPPNIIAGHLGNSVAPGVYGATLFGGGSSVAASNSITASLATISGGSRNAVHALLSTIGGGGDNFIGQDAERSTIGGGYINRIEPETQYGSIGGGYFNVIGNSAFAATISGGYWNEIQSNAMYSAISGGRSNIVLASARYATIPGGHLNSAAGKYSLAAGQRAKALHDGSFVWADSGNADFSSTSLNQFLVRASGGVGINKSNPSTVLDVAGTVTATAFAGSILKAQPNSSLELNSDTSVRINLDEDNNGTISAFAIETDGNDANLFAVTEAGLTTVSSSSATGGLRVDGTGGSSTTPIIEARDNTTPRFVVQRNGYVGVGGAPSAPLDVTVATGLKLQMRQDGVVPGINVATSGGNAGIMRLRNAMEIWPSDDAARAGKIDIRDTGGSPTVVLNGANGQVTCVSLNQTSDRNVKENCEALEPKQVLEKVVALPVSKWNYRVEGGSVKHIGPMAQDFHAAFGVGTDDKHIATVDADGVALAAIQGLNEIVQEKDAKIQSLEIRLAELEKIIRALAK